MLERGVNEHRRVRRLRSGFWRMTSRAVRLDMNVLDRIRPVGQRPQYGVGIGGINIFADGDDDLAAVSLLRRRPLHSTPDLGPRRAVGELQKNNGANVAQRLVHDDLADSLYR